MNVIVDFCIVPIGVGVSLSPYVVACERVLQAAGLKMDLFLPAAPFEKLDHYSDVPMSRQPQFGKYWYDSALLSLCDAKLGRAFEQEWASRICCMTVVELRNAPANAALRRKSQQTAPH